MSDSLTPADKPQHPFAEKLRGLMKEYNITGVMLYVLPEDLTQTGGPAYHVARLGHFYDTAQLVSLHVREIKEKMMHDFDGLM